MKKILASMLAVSMLATVAVPAFAYDPTEEDVTATYAGAVKKDATLSGTGNLSNGVYDNARPDSTYYFVVADGASGLDVNNDSNAVKNISVSDLADGDLFKFDYDKTEGGKNISSIKLIQKEVAGTADSKRDLVVEVKTRDDMTPDEFTANFEVTFKAKSKWLDKDSTITNGMTITMEEVKMFIGNNNNPASDDDTTMAGDAGFVYKPASNEENTVEWEDENDTLAFLTFDADSSVVKYFPKMSTKWDNVVYAELFNDQDAFVRDFVANPEISSTSRAVLDLVVPYFDEDGDLTVSEEDIIVYQQMEDGVLEDITAKGEFVTNDDDSVVFRIKTRQLGTYIFAEAPVTEVADEEVVEETPVTDDIKTNPGTGF